MASNGSPLWSSLVRGTLCGLAAGLLLGLFHLAFSEPLIERALRFEEPSGGAELFTRGEQQAGLVLASVLYGAALGGIFGFAFPLLARRLSASSVWQASLRLAFAGFATLWLVPFFKYPANPPAVGSSDTIGLRTAGYTGMIAISIAATTLAWWTVRRLSKSEPHAAQLVAGGQYLVVIAIAYWLLPNNPDEIPIPAGLLWDFRLASLAGQALLWLTLGAGFGLLTIRAAHRTSVRTQTAVNGG